MSAKLVWPRACAELAERLSAVGFWVSNYPFTKLLICQISFAPLPVSFSQTPTPHRRFVANKRQSTFRPSGHRAVEAFFRPFSSVQSVPISGESLFSDVARCPGSPESPVLACWGGMSRDDPMTAIPMALCRHLSASTPPPLFRTRAANKRLIPFNKPATGL